MDPQDWIAFEVFGNTMLRWGIAAGISLLVLTAFVIARRVLRKSLHSLAERTASRQLGVAAAVVSKTTGWFLFTMALFFGSRVLSFPDKGGALWMHIVVIVLLVQLGIWAAAGLGRLLSMRRAEQLKEDPGSVAAMDMMHFAARVAIWAFVFLLALDNLGVNITALVAGLGVGGIAVALAAQSILSDLFASLSIVLDKPFVVGDFLIINDFLGSVEKVGLKTTRLRSLSGEQLIFSNTDLLNSRIRNYGRMFERRVLFSVGVTYQTSRDAVERIPGIIREAIEAQEPVRFDRAHFQKFGDFALVFEAVYYVLSSDYAVYMDIQQAINLQIFDRFEEHGIDFAYPTQTLYVNKVPEASAGAQASK